MPNQILSIKAAGRKTGYDIHVNRGLLGRIGNLTSTAFPTKPKRIAIISNPTVVDLYAESVVKSLEKSGYIASIWLMNDGERYKSLSSAEKALEFLSSSGVTRTDALVALGGGVVGDLTGFVSSIYLRGVPFIQVPTTLLSMIDSSVGGKAGVNTKFGKNLVGSFYAPSLVVADVDTLKTLPKREFTAGLCEAVKQGAIGGSALFNKTASFLAGKKDRITDVVTSHIAFKASIVRQDEFEAPERTDAKSRKILNFGHTFAHALEKATNYRYFRHGEAVGYGIIFASTLSNYLELLDTNTLELLNDVVHRCGVLPSLRSVDPNKVHEAFRSDKKFIDGKLQWVMLAGIGKPAILQGSQIPTSALTNTFNRIFDEH